MPDLAAIPGISELWGLTTGDRRVRIAVIDGAPDLSHPCFDGSAVEVVAGHPATEPTEFEREQSIAHGTWSAGVLVGQHASASPGVAPGCTLLAISNLVGDMLVGDALAIVRCIEAACAAGAHVLLLQRNMPSRSGDADELLKSAIRTARKSGTLLVVPAGNDDETFRSYPQALAEVMLVGAYDDDGVMFKFSGWGFGYEQHGIVAPGGNISGPEPGGGLVTHKGTCCSAAIVAGVAALLLSLRLQHGQALDALAVGDALMQTARPCELDETHGRPARCLAGKLDVAAATRRVLADIRPALAPVPTEPGAGIAGRAAETTGVVVPAEQANDHETDVPTGPLVYALGSLNYDFGTHARRDSFAQLMAAVEVDGTVVPANPHNPRQVLDHLQQHAAEEQALIWTLNIELTPIYAIAPSKAHAPAIFALLTRLLAGELAGRDDERHIERVAIPGRLSGQTVKLFSGQIVPRIEVAHVRGIEGWPVGALTHALLAHPQRTTGGDGEAGQALHELLTHIYYDIRNLGMTAVDRALNYAVTTAFTATDVLLSAIGAGLALDAMYAHRRAYCRPGSDCWDVTLRFFDPEHSKRTPRIPLLSRCQRHRPRHPRPGPHMV